MLGQWREQRNQLQTELDTEQQDAPTPYDVEAIMAELDELGSHITGDSIPLAQAAFHRVFESISHYWEQVSPRRKELVRAEILPRFPFSLTTSMSTRPKEANAQRIRLANHTTTPAHEYARQGLDWEAELKQRERGIAHERARTINRFNFTFSWRCSGWRKD